MSKIDLMCELLDKNIKFSQRMTKQELEALVDGPKPSKPKPKSKPVSKPRASKPKAKPATKLQEEDYPFWSRFEETKVTKKPSKKPKKPVETKPVEDKPFWAQFAESKVASQPETVVVRSPIRSPPKTPTPSPPKIPTPKRASPSKTPTPSPTKILTPKRASPSKTPLRSPIRPQTPVRSPIRSPSRTPIRSPSKTPIRSPSSSVSPLHDYDRPLFDREEFTRRATKRVKEFAHDTAKDIQSYDDAQDQIEEMGELITHELDKYAEDDFEGYDADELFYKAMKVWKRESPFLESIPRYRTMELMNKFRYHFGFEEVHYGVI